MTTPAMAAEQPRGWISHIETGKLGMWLFLTSEVMFFTGMLGGYIVLRLGAEYWPDPNSILAIPVLALNTFILICSSVSYVLGLQAIQNGDVKKMIRFTIVTMALGLAFLTIKILDYAHMISNGHIPQPGGHVTSDSLFYSCYFTLTGFHGLHVLGGVIAMGAVVLAAKNGKYSSKYYAGVENVGLYWHFVDLVWIMLFAILCLV